MKNYKFQRVIAQQPPQFFSENEKTIEGSSTLQGNKENIVSLKQDGPLAMSQINGCSPKSPYGDIKPQQNAKTANYTLHDYKRILS